MFFLPQSPEPDRLITTIQLNIFSSAILHCQSFPISAHTTPLLHAAHLAFESSYKSPTNLFIVNSTLCVVVQLASPNHLAISEPANIVSFAFHKSNELGQLGTFLAFVQAQ